MVLFRMGVLKAMFFGNGTHQYGAQSKFVSCKIIFHWKYMLLKCSCAPRSHHDLWCLVNYGICKLSKHLSLINSDSATLFQKGLSLPCLHFPLLKSSKYFYYLKKHYSWLCPYLCHFWLHYHIHSLFWTYLELNANQQHLICHMKFHVSIVQCGKQDSLGLRWHFGQITKFSKQQYPYP